jgi:hypothetical protein
MLQYSKFNPIPRGYIEPVEICGKVLTVKRQNVLLLMIKAQCDKGNVITELFIL